MRVTSKNALLLTAFLALAAPARAEPFVEPSSDLRFERTPIFDGKSFLCLGAGIRKKYFMQVYAIDFCIEEAAGRAALSKWLAKEGKRRDGESAEELGQILGEDPEFFSFVMAMPVEKSADIVFVRDVPREKLREAFAWSLVQVLGEGERPRIEEFVAMIDRDMKAGDRMTLRTKPSGEVTLSLDVSHQVTDEKLCRAVWKTYLGPESVTPALKASVAMGTARYATQ